MEDADTTSSKKEQQKKLEAMEEGEVRDNQKSVKSLSDHIKQIYENEGLPVSDEGSEETIGDLCDDERNELLEQHFKKDEPPAKKMRFDDPIVPIPVKRNFYVHVERDLRERAFFMLAKQRCGIQLVQCDSCRANRLHQISQQYGNDHLILVNMCEHCLKTNMYLASLYNTFWPKVELHNVQRINHHLPGEGCTSF